MNNVNKSSNSASLQRQEPVHHDMTDNFELALLSCKGRAAGVAKGGTLSRRSCHRRSLESLKDSFDGHGDTQHFLLPRQAWKSQLAFLKILLKAKQALDRVEDSLNNDARDAFFSTFKRPCSQHNCGHHQ
ncbi:MAG: hypothetical protein JOZ78_23945 [Chroococcidiopsidaceae cyanobacterium CP_BM_ER_R8_30]|nr:hypothetical protein [Chroococcidiopsidaceae cyanobacterium CP_BM_ER_R8_30]